MSANANPGTELIDLDAGWRLHPQVALRRESFGGLAYNYGTRRLSMIRSVPLLELIISLEQHQSARVALHAARVEDERLAPYEHALKNLVDAGVITRREGG